MTNTSKISFLIAIFSALFSSAFAQESSNSLPTVSVFVSIVDTHGRAFRELTKENFRVHMNGKPATVVDAQYRAAPRRIVVLLDLSGSMLEDKTTHKWQIARAALEDFLAQTPAEAPIAMLTFSNQVQDRFGFSEGRAAVAKWLHDQPNQPPLLKHPAKTALLDAIAESLRVLQPFKSGDAIYAITDGGDNNSRTSASQLMSELLSSGVRVFALVFAEPAVGLEGQNETAFLNTVAASGGFAFGVQGHQRLAGPSWKFDYTDDKENQERVMAYTQELNILVHGFWRLEVIAPPPHKGTRVHLEITDKDGKKRKDVYLVYPRVISATKRPT